MRGEIGLLRHSGSGLSLVVAGDTDAVWRCCCVVVLFTLLSPLNPGLIWGRPHPATSFLYLLSRHIRIFTHFTVHRTRNTSTWIYICRLLNHWNFITTSDIICSAKGSHRTFSCFSNSPNFQPRANVSINCHPKITSSKYTSITCEVQEMLWLLVKIAETFIILLNNDPAG